MNEYDIIIVGAGPAGLNAGSNAALQGVKTLILDKKHTLGLPVRCGEATVETIFEDFKIDPGNDLIANKVNTIKLYSSMGKKLEMNLKLAGYILNRDKFEQHLGKIAKNNGVEIQLDTTVVGYKNKIVTFTNDHGKTFNEAKGKIIIAADGVESRIGRWAGLNTTIKPKDIAVCQQYFIEDIEVDKTAVEFYWGKKYSPHAYIWVFPKGDNCANVGILSFGSLKIDMNQYLNKFLKERAPMCRRTNFTTGCIPQTIPPRSVIANNVILVGDAARVAISVTGAGIGHALKTGMWAGKTAGRIVANNETLDGLAKYDEKVNTLRRKLQRSYRLKEKVLKDGGFYETMFALAKPIPIFYRYWPDLFHKFFLKNLRY